jgi:hypothetical protein
VKVVIGESVWKLEKGTVSRRFLGTKRGFREVIKIHKRSERLDTFLDFVFNTEYAEKNKELS